MELVATESEQGVCAADGPVHSGLFEPRSDNGFSASLIDTAANEQLLATGLRVSHAQGVAVEVIGVDAKLFRQLPDCRRETSAEL